jgi:hypothetical protein
MYHQAWIPERNVQVPRMRSIRNEARLVWIWLGEGIEEIDIAFSFLSEVAAILEKKNHITKFSTTHEII